MRVDRDAVTADADARLVDVAVRLAVRGGDHLGDVHPDAVRIPAELVGQRDVHVAIGRVGELRELRGLGRAHRDDLGVQHALVERGGAGGAGRAEPADELRVGRQVHAARRRCRAAPARTRPRSRPCRAGRAEAGDGLEARRVPPPGVADGQRGLEDDRRAGVDAGGDRLDRGVHPAVVGPRLVVEDDRDDQHHDVGRAGRLGAVERGAQLAGRVGVATRSARPGSSPTCDFPALIEFDDARVDVHRDHRPAVRGELPRERQAHLAGADDGHGPGRAGLADPWRDVASRTVAARVGRQRDRAAGEAVRDALGRALGLMPTPARRCGGRAPSEEGVRQDDGPAAVVDVHDRAVARADDVDEGGQLGQQRLLGRDRELGDLAGERRGIAARSCAGWSARTIA